MNLLDSPTPKENSKPQPLNDAMKFYRPTWVEISRSAFASNLKAIQKYVGQSVQVMAVLKADAYGHSATTLAAVAHAENIPWIGVSSLEEALALKENGCTASILILGGIYPLENFSVVIDHGLIPTVASLESAQFLKKMAAQKKKSLVPFHLKVDTGMGRIGVSVEGLKPILEWLKKNPEIILQGVYSHLSSADVDAAFTNRQLEQFSEVKRLVLAAGFEKVLFHVANSAGLIFGKNAFYDMVRPGLLMYGLSPTQQEAIKLKPVLSWKSRVVYLKKVSAGTPISYAQTFVTAKETEVATIPVGYADGVPRSVSNKGFVLIKGHRCPIVGRVTMDHIMVDVTNLDVAIGESVILIGEQGDKTLSVDEWAAWAGTISYEIVCGISKRVPRVTIE